MVVTKPEDKAEVDEVEYFEEIEDDEPAIALPCKNSSQICIFEPSHQKREPSVVRFEIMQSHSSGILSKVSYCSLIVSTVSPEPSLCVYVISTVFTCAGSCRNSFDIIHLSSPMTKPTKWHMRTAKTPISLGIHPV